jgi:predicted transcriptional regulator
MKKSELKQLIKEEIEKVLNEAKKTFKLKIINKNGSATIQQVSVDTSTTELFDIVALIKKSPKVEDVKILED